jgi:hypothetical protein
MREILKIENGGSPLKWVVLMSSVSGFGGGHFASHPRTVHANLRRVSTQRPTGVRGAYPSLTYRKTYRKAIQVVKRHMAHSFGSREIVYEPESAAPRPGPHPKLALLAGEGYFSFVAKLCLLLLVLIVFN